MYSKTSKKWLYN